MSLDCSWSASGSSTDAPSVAENETGHQFKLQQRRWELWKPSEAERLTQRAAAKRSSALTHSWVPTWRHVSLSAVLPRPEGNYPQRCLNETERTHQRQRTPSCGSILSFISSSIFVPQRDACQNVWKRIRNKYASWRICHSTVTFVRKKTFSLFSVQIAPIDKIR